MENKNKLMFGALLFLVLFSLALISSTITITIDNPIASETISGTYVFNVTTSSYNVTNCTWSTTADINFSTTVNTSAYQTIFTNSTDTTALTDASSTTLTVTCYNNTNEYETTTRTIAVDNTDPTCSFLLGIGEETIDYMDAYGVYPTDASTDAIDTSLTYAWVLWDPSGNSQQTSTSSTPNFAGLDFEEIGEFTLSLTVTDNGGNSNNCANKTIMVQGTNGEEIIPSVMTTFIKTNQTPILVIGGVFILIFLAVMGFFGINKKKSLKK